MTIVPSRNVEIGAYQPLVTTFSSADRYVDFLCVSVYRHIIDYLLFIPSRWPHSESTALQLNPNEASVAHVFSPRGALLPPCAEEHWTALCTTFWGHLKQWNHHQKSKKKKNVKNVALNVSILQILRIHLHIITIHRQIHGAITL